MEPLLNIAKQILSANPEAILSGSIALRMQGVKTMREPKDIDIYIPYGVEFNKLPEMMMANNPDNDEYPDDGWERYEYSIGKVKIDVFQPQDGDVNEQDHLVGNSLKIQGLPLIDKLDIIKFKASHSLGDHFTFSGSSVTITT